MPGDWAGADMRLVGVARHDGMPTPASSPSLYDQTLWFIHRGLARVTLDGLSREARRGTLFWFRPRLHPETWQARNRRLSLTVVRFRFTRTPWPDGAWPVPEWIPYMDAEWMEGFFDRLHDATEGAFRLHTAIRADGRERAEALLKALVLEIVHAAPRAGAHDAAGAWDPVTRGVSAWAARISENPTGLPPVQAMAESVGVSTGHFSARFRAYTTLAPQRFAIVWRIRHACRLLLETRLPIKAVAEALGYGDVFFFSRQFKAVAGATPRDFRRRGKQPSFRTGR